MAAIVFGHELEGWDGNGWNEWNGSGCMEMDGMDGMDGIVFEPCGLIVNVCV